MACPVAPFGGDESAGATGAATIVVKFQGAPVAVVLPPAFLDVTLQ